MRLIYSFACIASLVLLLSLHPSSASSLSASSWLQQGIDSSGTGFAPSSTFNATAVSVAYSQQLQQQQCQTSFVYSTAANSFFFTCWNYDASGNNNATFWQIDGSTGNILYSQSLTGFAQSLAGPQLATAALYAPSETTAEGSIVFQQTNIELWAFTLGASGVVQSAVSIPLSGTVQCGNSLSISPSLQLVFLISNADVIAYSVEGFTSSSKPAWTFSYPNPGYNYILSSVSEDSNSNSSTSGGGNMLLFTFSRSGWGSDIVALEGKTGQQVWSTFYPFPGDTTSIASTPLLYASRAYISLYPLGLVTLDAIDGTILNNGSYVLNQATGVSPTIWIRGGGSANTIVVYECETNDGIDSIYELCLSDLDGNSIRPWSGGVAAVLGCFNDSKLTSYGVVNQPIVTRNGVVVSASSSKQLLHYQEGPLENGLIFASPFVDQMDRIYIMAASNDFTSTLLGLQGAEEETTTKRQEEEMPSRVADA